MKTPRDEHVQLTQPGREEFTETDGWVTGNRAAALSEFELRRYLKARLSISSKKKRNLILINPPIQLGKYSANSIWAKNVHFSAPLFTHVSSSGTNN